MHIFVPSVLCAPAAILINTVITDKFICGVPSYRDCLIVLCYRI